MPLAFAPTPIASNTSYLRTVLKPSHFGVQNDRIGSFGLAHEQKMRPVRIGQGQANGRMHLLPTSPPDGERITPGAKLRRMPLFAARFWLHAWANVSRRRLPRPNRAGACPPLAPKKPLFPTGHQQTPSPPASMAPTNNSKWVMLREVVDAMRRAEKTIGQQPTDMAACGSDGGGCPGG
jgi:hypothetical protein